MKLRIIIIRFVCFDKILLDSEILLNALKNTEFKIKQKTYGETFKKLSASEKIL